MGIGRVRRRRDHGPPLRARGVGGGGGLAGLHGGTATATAGDGGSATRIRGRRRAPRGHLGGHRGFPGDTRSVLNFVQRLLGILGRHIHGVA